MALKYYTFSSGNALIVGLSSDTKPVLPANGLVFLEEDTAKVYTIAGGTWTENLNASYGTAAAVALKAPIASPTFTGTVVMPSGQALVTTVNNKTLTLGGNYGIAWAKYSFATDGGAVSTITPGATVNTVIPDNAILTGGTWNSTTAVTSDGSATVAIGVSAGGATNTILAATGKATFTLDAIGTTTTTFASPAKMTAAGSITFTIATAALTAGVIEVFIHYWVPAA